MINDPNGQDAAVDAVRVTTSHWLIVALTLITASLAVFPTFLLLWPKWSQSHTYSHGLLILPLCIWLIFRQRHALASIKQKPFTLALVPLAGLLFGWTWAYAANISIGAEALLPLILIISVLAVSGWRAAGLIAVPVLILYSAIPVWDVINSSLQSMTTAAVSVILNIVRVPAFIQGNIVQIPAGVFEIAGGCSGIHFFIVAETLAAVYGHLYYRSARDKALLLLIAGAMSIAMNWIRVATIIVAGHLTDMQSYLVQVDHYTFGWVLFAFMLVPFYLIARRLEKDVEPAAVDGTFQVARWSPMAFVVILLVAPVFVWARLATNEPQPIEISLPSVEGLRFSADETAAWKPMSASPDGEIQGVYRRGERKIEVYANWYFTQSQGRELMGYRTTLAGRASRSAYDKPIQGDLAGNAAKSLEIREIMADLSTGERKLIWHHLLIGGESRMPGIESQLRLGLLAIIGSEASGAIALAVTCDERDCDQARSILEDEFRIINSAISDQLLSLEKP